MLVVLVSPTASAQEPPDVSQGGIDVRIEERSGTVSLEQPSRFTVIVRNLAESSPLDDARRVNVTLSVSGVPDGWTASVSPASVRLQPGEEKSVALQVAVSAGSQEEAATIVVTGTAQQDGGTIGPVPVFPTSSDTVEIRITQSEDATRSLLERLGDWIWFLLLALLAAAMVIGKLFVDRRRVTVSVHVDENQLEARPGEKLEVPVHVRNAGRGRDSIMVYVAPLERGWRAIPRMPEVTLDGGASTTVPVRVEVPEGAEAGEAQRVIVTAQSVQTPGKQALVTLRVTVAAAGEPAS